MKKQRLLKLADLLEADARKKRGAKFNLSMVGRVAERPEDGVVKLNCGTEACAMGLAAISGAFKRAGLSYKLRHDAFWGVNVDTTVAGKVRHYDIAAMKVFGLTKKQACFLFSPAHPSWLNDQVMGAVGERRVARRIRDFVAGKVAA